jgi:hypothetical protein
MANGSLISMVKIFGNENVIDFGTYFNQSDFYSL